MNRLNWTIESKGLLLATFIPTGEKLVARTKSELMSKINLFTPTCKDDIFTSRIDPSEEF